MKSQKGRLILKEVEYDDVLIRTVGKNNKTSGKITLPNRLIGQKVYVVIPTGVD